MLIGYMRVSTDGNRQALDLERDALLATGVDERHLFDDHANGICDALLVDVREEPRMNGPMTDALRGEYPDVAVRADQQLKAQ